MFETKQTDLFPPSATAVLNPPVRSTICQNSNGPTLQDSFARLYSVRRKTRFPKKRRSRWSQSFHSLRNESFFNQFHDLLQTYLLRGRSSRVLEVGCGSGKFCHTLVERGYQTYGVDQSHILLQQARQIAPGCEFERGSIYESYHDLFLQQFEAIVYLEPIEHLVFPASFIQTAFESLAPGGVLIISARYRGYLINLTNAFSGRFDVGQTAGGSSYNSPTTLRTLLQDSGLEIVQSEGPGSIPHPWRSQLFVARKPLNQ